MAWLAQALKVIQAGEQAVVTLVWHYVVSDKI